MRNMTRRTIADEIKQTRPFRTRAQEALLSLLRTSHIVRRRLEAATLEQEITLQQYNVLRILRGAGSPLPTMEIAERMIEPSCGITRLVTGLEEKGLLRREQWPGDRRQFLCQLTPAGSRILAKLDVPMEELDDTLLGGLSANRLDALIDTLSELREKNSVSADDTVSEDAAGRARVRAAGPT
jgi:MarR family transcriptional regulator, organic hydroperoxide resistance regulator